MESVRTRWFFKTEINFPWDWFDGIPKIGMLHSYLCTMLAHYSTFDRSYYFRAKPSWSELQRFAKENDGLAKKIVDYCERVYDMPTEERKNVAQEVLFFLSNFEPFRKDFQERVDVLYRSGRINLPDECIPLSELPKEELL